MDKLDLSTKRILLVEDNSFNVELMQDMLETMGGQVELAEDGEEALVKCSENSYDIILMDVQMPKKDGLQTAKEIREKENGQKHTPILAITANALTGDREKCIEAGMDDYITKPVDIKLLREKLARLIGK